MQVLVYRFPIGWTARKPRLWLTAFPCMMQANKSPGNLTVGMINRKSYMIAYSVWGSEEALLQFERSQIHTQTMQDLQEFTTFEEMHLECHSVPGDAEVERVVNQLISEGNDAVFAQ